MNEQNTHNQPTPDRAHTVADTQSDRAHTVTADTHSQMTVYYWADSYWTHDAEEAALADRFGIYAGTASTLTVPDGSTQYDINQTVRDALNRAHTVTHA